MATSVSAWAARCGAPLASGFVGKAQLLPHELRLAAAGRDLVVGSVQPALDALAAVELKRNRVLRGAHPHGVRTARMEQAARRGRDEVRRSAGDVGQTGR